MNMSLFLSGAENLSFIFHRNPDKSPYVSGQVSPIAALGVGYEKVVLIVTTSGLFMTKKEAR